MNYVILKSVKFYKLTSFLYIQKNIFKSNREKQLVATFLMQIWPAELIFFSYFPFEHDLFQNFLISHAFRSNLILLTIYFFC